MKNNSNDSDSCLIDKAKNGDEGAFNFLMNKYYPRVYASLFSFTKSKEDSEDLAQQTFLKVWQQLKNFRGESAFFTWVYRIAINLAKNHVGSAGFKKQKINTSIDDMQAEFVGAENLLNDIMLEESIIKINKFVKELPESLKTSFILREENGKSYEEIAQITDTPIGTVRSRIFRARETIIEFINEELSKNDK